MPPVPIRNCRLAANSANTMTSVARTSAYSSPASGRSAAHAKSTSAPIAAGRPGATISARNSASGVVGGADGGLPRNPYGFTTSTTAITTNSATSVSLGNATATPKMSTVPRPMQSARVSPISSAARKAPGIEPRPPTTVTTNASAMIARSMPRLAGSCGSCSAPASPARNAPSANTAVNSARSLMPSAPAMTRFSVAARTSIPKRVLLDEPREAEQHERPDADEEEIVGRHRAPEHVDRAGEARRARTQQISRTPDRERRVADDQHDAERGRELQELWCGVDALQQQRLDQRAEHRDGERGDEHAAPEAERAASKHLDQRPREVRAQHVERAVREVDDAGDAEDQRQAGGDEEQRRRAGEAGQELREQGGGGHASANRAAACNAPLAAILARGGADRRNDGARRSGASRHVPVRSGRRSLSRRGASASRRRRRAGSPCRRHSASRPSRPCHPSRPSARRRRPSSIGGRGRGRSPCRKVTRR